MDTPQTITHVSLCAGYGGIDLGLKRAIPDLRTIAFSEIEGYACANLVAKMEAGLLDAAPIWTNLKTFPWSEFRGKVDILSGGYPCQPFSAAGKRLGTEDPRHLWPFIADGIRLMQPRVCFFENVEGHISLGLRAVIEELGSMGYQVSWGIFSASEVGAPHQRKRVFILAHRQSTRLEGYHRLLIGRDEPRRESSQPERSVGGSDSSGTALAHTECYGSREGRALREGPDGAELVGESDARGAWPNCPGQPQHGWEPPRVVGNTESQRSSTQRAKHEGLGGELCAASASGESIVGNAEGGQDHGRESRDLAEESGCGTGGDHAADCTGKESHQRKAEPSLGGDANGSASGLDYAELCVTCDNRTDELRLLGNGVVPATATRAFLTLVEELNESPSLPTSSS